MTRIAAILARGLGTRMQRADESVALDVAQHSAATTGAKGMIPFGRPFLDYSLSALADAGIERVVLVVAPEHNAMRAHYDAQPPERVRLGFAVQAEPLGTADAVLSAARAIGELPFLVLNADNLYPADVLRALAEQDGAAVAAFAYDALVAQSNIEPARVRQFALLSINASGLLGAVVEKPEAGDHTLPHGARSSPFDSGDHAEERWVSMNAWRVTADIVHACRRVARSTRGEFELPEAVALAIAEGVRVRAVPVHSGVLDLSHRRDIAAVAEQLRHVVAQP